MRIIDADKIPYLHVDGFGVTSYAHRADIEKMPTIDPVHAAGGCYCRECKFWSDDGRCEPHENGLIREYTKPTDFCSYGEPKEVQDA